MRNEWTFACGEVKPRCCGNAAKRANEECANLRQDLAPLA